MGSEPRDPENAASSDGAQADTLGPGEADFESDDAGLSAGAGMLQAVALRDEDLKGALESLILVSDKPVAAVRLARLTRQDIGHVKQLLAELVDEYQGRGIVLDEIAGGFQFRTSARFAPFVRTLVQQKPTKLTRPQLETLSIVAYRQPVTRPEIDDVRGVDSGYALKVLLERNLIKIVGKKDEAGRPMLYATTQDFLVLFGLKNLRELPTLREFAELTDESRDIYERRIGEAVPNHGAGMDLETHYEAPPDGGEGEDGADGEADQLSRGTDETHGSGEEVERGGPGQ